MANAETPPAPSLEDTRWTGLIDELRKWPLDAPEWEVVQGFIDQVQVLAKEKEEERAIAARLQLKNALDRLLLTHKADIVDYFSQESSDLSNWQAIHCPIPRLPDLTKMVQDLQRELAQLEALNQQVPTNYLDARQLRTDLTTLEDRIDNLVKGLNHEFGAANPESQRNVHEDDQDKEDKEDDDDVEVEEEVSSLPPGPSGDCSASAQVPEAEPPPCEDTAQEDSPKKAFGSPSRDPKPDLQSRSEESESDPSQPIPSKAPVPEEGARLHSAKEMALLLQEDDRDENWTSLAWSLLAEDDLSGAYWLTRSLEAAERETPIAPPLLAALQCSSWLQTDDDSLVFDIQQIASDYAPQSTTSERLLGLAAALRPTLLSQYTGLMAWLPQKDEVTSVFGVLADAIRSFATAGYPLRPEDPQGVEGIATREQVAEKTVEEARRLLQAYGVRKLKFKRATDVLHHLAAPNGHLHFLLTTISANRPDQADELRQRLKDFEGKKQIERLHLIDRTLAGAKKRKITGDPLNQLVRSVEEVHGLARRWCSLVAQKQSVNQEGDWQTDHVEALRDRVQRVLPDIKDHLEGMQAKDQPEESAALGRVLQREIREVTGMLRLDPKAAREGAWAWTPLEAGSLNQALASRLLWMPEISLADDGYPQENQLAGIAKFLRESIAGERTLRDVSIRRIDDQDFRFTSLLHPRLADEDRREVEDHYENNLQGARAALADEVDVVRGIIERGTIDGLLVEEERATLSSQLERTVIEDPLHFGPLRKHLESIEQQLNTKLEDRLSELKDQWQNIRHGLVQSPQAPQLGTVDAFLRQAFDQGDTRVIEESLAHLGDFLQGESAWQSEWFDPPDEQDLFQEFRDAVPCIESAIGPSSNLDQFGQAIEEGASWEGVPVGTWSVPHQDETVKALRSWHQLRRRQGQQAENRTHIHVLLEYLGLHLSAREADIRIQKHGRDWLYCQVSASVSDLARPIPQLGSQANGCYNVMCIWERPGAESMGSILRDLGLAKETVIVLFLGQLNGQRRREMSVRAKERELALVVLDAILLVFLTRFEDARFPTFLRCSLPYAFLNPYTPFQAGNVPPEMYYGRDSMVRQLQNEGSCIVFGGRQLGKSALLRQVQREFHQPAQEQFAWVEDIKLVGDPITGQPPSSLWIKLRERFKRCRLIGRNVTANQPENIFSRIQDAMNGAPQRKVLVLFDEADHFLDADARENFPVVDRLRSLMQETGQRFRVVFAGLHDVQRFNNIANQPLAHFGRNLLVGPLEAGPARQLVQEPLRTLGYRFADDVTVLKVLSYTNYHPGLIQYFCHELLRLLQARTFAAGPPYEVKAEDVEAVYRSPQARQVIRERLDWTLALDPRYQCIAWAMICEPRETSESHGGAFGVGELLELVQEWWPQGFKEVDSEGLRGLLGEMVGLGILVRNLENQYLLRSPNLVRLMGTHEDIGSRLVELSERAPPTQSQADSQHVLLDFEERLYSPLTLVQEGRLQQARSSSVSLVLGSEALGLKLLDRALERMDGSEIPAGELRQASRACEWLDSHARARKQQGKEQVLAFGRLGGTGGDIAECVWRVSEMCKKFRRRRPLQVVLILDPNATWSWLKVTDQGTDRESWTDPINLRRWDEVGIERRLKEADKVDSADVCKMVLEATGGWPFLLSELLKRCGSADDPRPHARTLIEEMEGGKEVGKELLRKAGLASHVEVRRVLQALVGCGTVSEGDLLDLGELVEGDPPLTGSECRMAVEFLYCLGGLEEKDGEYSVETALARIVDHL